MTAVAAFGQPGRLAVMRLLIRSGPDGLPAGRIAGRPGVVQNTLSGHLFLPDSAHLTKANRHGRSIIDGADMDGMRALIDVLLQDCCGISPENCAPVLDRRTCAC